MKTSDLSVKELAAFIGVSTDTIRRTVRKGELPATRVGTALRFDLRKVHAQMEGNAIVRLRKGSASAPGGTAGRALTDQPPSGKTGALFLGTDDASFQQLTGRPCYHASTRTRTWGTGGPASAHLSPVWEHLVASSPVKALALPQMQEPLLGSSSPSQRVEACRQDSAEARGPERLLAGGRVNPILS